MRVEEGPKRVRVVFGGEVVADSTRVKLVYEVPYYPQYYFPVDDVRTEVLGASGHTMHSPSRGNATLYDIAVGRGAANDVALRYEDSPIPELRDLIRFDWHAMDGWFEEDEEVFVHPRDPATRVDVLASSRHVQVVIDGVTVADTHHPHLLFETRLPTRFYIPKVDVRMDLLEPTATESQCPYKGTARYWSVRTDAGVTPDVAWSYPSPFPESAKIAGLIAFYNERVDHVVDGELLDRPHTKFS